MSPLTKIGFGGLGLSFTVFGAASLGVFPDALDAFLITSALPFTAVLLGVVLASIASANNKLAVQLSQLVHESSDLADELRRHATLLDRADDQIATLRAELDGFGATPPLPKSKGNAEQPTG